MIFEAGGVARPLRAARLATLLSERGLGGDDPRPVASSRAFARARQTAPRRARPARRLADGIARAAPSSPLARGLAAAGPPFRRRIDRAGLSRPHRQGARGGRLHDGERPRGFPAAGARAFARNLSRRRRNRWARRSFAHSRGGGAFARRNRGFRGETHRDSRRNALRARRTPRCAGGASRNSARSGFPSRTWRSSPTLEAAQLLAQGAASLGIARLPWSKAQLQLRDRVAFLRAAEGEEWPDLSDAALSETAADWLAPHILGRTSLASDRDRPISRLALAALLPYALRRRMDEEAPAFFETPAGSSIALDYAASSGPCFRCACRSSSASRATRRSPRPRSRDAGAAFARASPDPDDARPSGLLERLLERRQKGDEGPLSAPCLARRSRERIADEARAARGGEPAHFPRPPIAIGRPCG